jgi:hypothetical protein
MIRKSIFVLIAFALMATPAFADNRPEFDAVDCDAQNVFNAVPEDVVVANAFDSDNVNVNENSIFNWEMFYGSGGQPKEDPCFGSGYQSILTPQQTSSYYQWTIVLQMQPESDIDLDIRNCVMKPQGKDIFTEAQQTGRFRRSNGELRFVRSANPRMTVVAYPGPFAHPGWKDTNKYFYFWARRLPGLGPFGLIEALYTSKGHWEEGVCMILPKTGVCGPDGHQMYQLRQGDTIEVTVDIPENNTTDLRYGSDNVVLRYIGMVNTEYIGDKCSNGNCPGCS